MFGSVTRFLYFMFGFVTKDVWMRWKFSQKMLTLRKLAFAEEQSMD